LILFAFSSLALALHRFTRIHCLPISKLRMHVLQVCEIDVLLKNLLID